MDQFSMPIGAARSTERVQSIFGPARSGESRGATSDDREAQPVWGAMTRSTRIRPIFPAAREAKVRSLRWINDWDAGVPPKGRS
ncbi:hypothetical protein ABC766_22850 [Methylobacterium fujisawaense]|uniref:hypothetical protein n=1 Tax=Methylobacterium fujisawaense TaxID=107400 RepID=UPI0031F5AD68